MLLVCFLWACLRIGGCVVVGCDGVVGCRVYICVSGLASGGVGLLGCVWLAVCGCCGGVWVRM